MMAKIAYRVAREHVQTFANFSEDLMERHAAAMECRDCEDYLQLGIDAFRWLTRADETIREAILDGEVDYRRDMDEAITNLYKGWLKPYDFAEQWISLQQGRNFKMENVSEFRRCAEEVRAILRNSSELSGKMLDLRDAAIADFKAGKTDGWEVKESQDG